MQIVYDAIWGFKEDILKARGRFKERVWLAHLAQPWGIPLHKCRGKVTLDENKIIFSGRDKDTQRAVEFVIPRQNILEVYLGWDNVIRRWRDTRALVRPLRINFKTDEEIKDLYLYAKEESRRIFGEKNKEIYEALR